MGIATRRSSVTHSISVGVTVIGQRLIGDDQMRYGFMGSAYSRFVFRPDWMSIAKMDNLIENYRKGIICVCEKCGKIDIDPYDHFLNCNPIHELHRQEQRGD